MRRSIGIPLALGIVLSILVLALAVGWQMERVENDALSGQNKALRARVVTALSELGVPGPGYPASVANAVAILNGDWKP